SIAKWRARLLGRCEDEDEAAEQAAEHAQRVGQTCKKPGAFSTNTTARARRGASARVWRDWECSRGVAIRYYTCSPSTPASSVTLPRFKRPPTVLIRVVR